MMNWFIPWIMMLGDEPVPVAGKPQVPSIKVLMQPLVQLCQRLARPAFFGCLIVVAVGRVFAWLRKSAGADGSASSSKSSFHEQRHAAAKRQKSAVDDLLDQRTTLQKIGQLSWAEFETLLQRLFERLGYSVERTGKNSADGGIDLILNKDSERTIVQCKHWQARQVPVSVVREQLGLKHSHRAHHCIIVTSGTFTADGRKFAEENGIILISGADLQQLVQETTTDVFQQLLSKSNAFKSQESQETAPTCPRCGGRTVKKTARKGRFEGLPFWACMRYPQCDGKVDAS